MATVKISQLNELALSSSVTAGDLLHIINTEEYSANYPTGTNKKIQAQTLADGLAALTTTIPAAIQNALNGKVSIDNFNNTGLKIVSPVVAASTVPLTLASVTAGSDMDGVTLVAGSRVLIKNQTNATENGIYVVAASGAPSRATDFDSAADINNGFVLVNGGTTQNGSGWAVTSLVGTIGSTNIVFTQFSAAISGISKAAVGLSNVDNTSDQDKQISTLTAAALNGKENTITGSASTITTGTLTAGRVVVSNSTTGKIEASTITNAQLGALSSIVTTTTIQDQLNSKSAINNPTFTGTVVFPGGTTTAAPIKLAAGTNLNNVVLGSVEFDGNNLYLTTNSASPTRKTIAFTDSSFTGNAATATTATTATTANSLAGLYNLKSGVLNMRSTWDTRGTVSWTRVVSGNYYNYTINYSGGSGADAAFRDACEKIEVDHWVPVYIPNYLYSGIYKVISIDVINKTFTFRVKNASLLAGWANPNVGTGNSGTNLTPFGIVADSWNRFLVIHSTLVADTANAGFLRSSDDGMLCVINLKTGYELPSADLRRLIIKSHYGDYGSNVYYTGLLPTMSRQLDYFNGTTNRSRGDGEWFNTTYAIANTDDYYTFTNKTIPIGISTAPRYAHFEIEYITAPIP